MNNWIADELHGELATGRASDRSRVVLKKS